MDFQEVIQFIQQNPACILATVDGERPRARGMLVLWAQEDGIYFTTGASKKLYSELTVNPNVELCFMTMEPLRALRVAGAVEPVQDLELKSKALGDRPWLKAAVDDPNFVLLKLAHGEAFFWTMKDNLHEAEIPRIRF